MLGRVINKECINVLNPQEHLKAKPVKLHERKKWEGSGLVATECTSVFREIPPKILFKTGASGSRVVNGQERNRTHLTSSCIYRVTSSCPVYL
jgi:hypothetical protein